MLLKRYLEQTEFTSYQDFRDHFEIKVPEGFNFAYDVVDEYARTEPDKVALVWCDDRGQTGPDVSRRQPHSTPGASRCSRGRRPRCGRS